MSDTFDLDRYVVAQKSVYPEVLAEIRAGRKRTHWMWFIFPQIAGLGSSEMARHYAIASLEEARAYLIHPLLGPRLIECVGALQGLATADAASVFGPIDAMKLRSSLSLFTAAGGPPIFQAALVRWFGTPDPATLERLRVV
ncbi:DUF1810 domain-containing protein [Sphingomonas sp. AP4-R1]|uniref:DUF1810 domain-containing protein n=1 Tax=Sphingomonas sp. AP4-R1 TaxID=2735134 RepID=UPI001493DDA3|nr:DUF1810 domain-containing protein [Sphingomonas sp. AP4-R1]QJU59263.1 DUF1810 domain-containing protein [Sphingomonas sp. AP4-R1]